ncbi:hypothetical protein HK097_008439 [Rhizophlyctis rosea]|uniref:Nucleoporin Nup133/Nup155-like N-terminal domain-containing protein n=1 Tax=Rhizophlyctis rosea TaxID=64517 RepID=A0AAD5X9F4_9FUNG|nr:hypothetical protein HK097_008439 [Rhizophlyctis rosea]
MAGPMYPRNGIGAAPSQGTPSPKLDDLNKTAGIIDTRLKEDTYPDVSDLISRLETDQSRERTDPKDTHVPFLQQDGFTDMSATISQQFDSLVCKSFMGFLPEIRRAWITVDHTLFLWNYEDPNSRPERDDDGEQIIVGVGLVKPAEGVFLEQIQHLLVVATPLEISITGVAVDDAHYKKLILYKTDLAIAADNVSMVQIEGTEEGRIFMVGHNGQLYELAYQSEDGFFSRKIRKLNHSATAMSVFIPTFFPWGKTDTVEKIAIDKARKLLYILRKDYQIELVYLGADGSGFTRISKTKNLSTDAQGKAERAHGRLDDRDFMVINIHPLKTTESTRFQLLAVTSSGHRLYFSCFDRPFEGQQPTNLKLLAVRDPLSTQNHGNYSTEQYPFHTTYYSDGFLLGCKVLNDEVDRLVVTAPNCGAISQSIPKHWVEQCDSTDVKCRTQDIAEVIQKPRNLCFEKDPDLTFNELALQLEYPPKKYSFLNTAGVAHYSTLRPIDILCEALNNTQDFTKAKNLFN